MDLKILKILIALAISAIIFLFDDRLALGEFYFYVATGWLALDILLKRRIELIHVWFTAFIYIILSEVFQSNFPTNEYTTFAFKYLLLCNNLVYIGYIYFTKESKRKSLIANDIKGFRASKYALTFLILLMLAYVGLKLPGAILAFRIGRIQAAAFSPQYGLIITSLLNATGFVLPAIIAFYYLFIKQTGVRAPLLLSLPIFIILFMYGTRFPLLFSVLGFAIVLQSKLMRKASLKTYVYLAISLISLFGATVLMKEIRVGNINAANTSMYQKADKFVNLPTYLSSHMSPEGVLDMTSLMFNYFRKNDHLYGESSSFLLYFWVPRQFWPDKPEMLGFWFIREYRQGFGSGHSASFGFAGDFYADFGWYSLMPVFFIGWLLRRGEDFKNRKFKNGGFGIIIGAMIFPYVFFAVRSPITSTMNFLGILLVYQMAKYILLKKVAS